MCRRCCGYIALLGAASWLAQTLVVAAELEGPAASPPVSPSAQPDAALRLSTYLTADTVRQWATDEPARTAALERLRALRIAKLYLEVYRSGVVLTQPQLERVRDFARAHGLAVAGAIATVPGGDFGVRANTGLAWFNWQSEKTQRDLETVVRRAAAVFDEFMVDDFLCRGDTSAESAAARGDRSWADYRRDLLSEVAERVFVRAAKAVNPSLQVIIKYPQWYDRFHLFGYDVERGPRVFDRVWVGTETRGARTQRFGFVQPYEGFVNYRWLATLAGAKLGGAWFDHGDCDAHDFVEQAWQSTLAGAPELVLFSYAAIATGHPGHALLRADLDGLTRLARAVRAQPVVGPAAYKPPHSDAGGDLYLMDFIGMLGIPLIPHAAFPQDNPVVFLPTQAAADPAIAQRIRAALRAGQDLVFTTGFLLAAPAGRELAELAGLAGLRQATPTLAPEIVVAGQPVPVEPGLGLAAELRPGAAQVLLEAVVAGRRIPFLTEHRVAGRRLAVLNTHTYTQADFDAVGEVLLAPRPLGLLEIPADWAQVVRRVFQSAGDVTLLGPTRVTLQPLGRTAWVLQNYNLEPVTVRLQFGPSPPQLLRDELSGAAYPVTDSGLALRLPARGRVWLRPEPVPPAP